MLRQVRSVRSSNNGLVRKIPKGVIMLRQVRSVRSSNNGFGAGKLPRSVEVLGQHGARDLNLSDVHADQLAVGVELLSSTAPELFRFVQVVPVFVPDASRMGALPVV